MPTWYNQIAGRSRERLAALSDGIFAVAMTLLVLDLHAPAAQAVHSERELARALLTLAWSLAIYAMSFLTLGIFWHGQQVQLHQLRHADLDLSWLHLKSLAAVTVMPFSTSLLASFIRYRVALLVYWLNLLVQLNDVLAPRWEVLARI
ncbi:MAG TPA: TMEM175 family protein [Terriglobales bacterium]|nr:TMEM175 family protein [Terriglobales bacterium]